MSWLFEHVGKQLDWKDKVNFKVYDVTTWTQAMAIHILPNISRGRDNQTMKLGLWIEYYNMRNIFLEKSCTKCGGVTIPRTFPKKSKLGISLNQ